MKALGLYPWLSLRWLHTIVSIGVRKPYSNLRTEGGKKRKEFEGNNFLPRQQNPIKMLIFQILFILMMSATPNLAACTSGHQVAYKYFDPVQSWTHMENLQRYQASDLCLWSVLTQSKRSMSLQFSLPEQLLP